MDGLIDAKKERIETSVSSLRFAEETRKWRMAARTSKKCEFIYNKHRFMVNKYGIGYTQYARLKREQSDKCAICGKHESECKRELSIDHCHTTGKIRGLLCFNCNTSIGKFFDNLDYIYNAALYLERHGVKSEREAVDQIQYNPMNSQRIQGLKAKMSNPSLYYKCESCEEEHIVFGEVTDTIRCPKCRENHARPAIKH